MKVTRTNTTPMVIGNFYPQCVQELGSSCPRRLQTNAGTKNGTMATIQCYLRRHDDDGLSDGKPIVIWLFNQQSADRYWWSHLKKSRTTWCINFFKDLCDSGAFLYGNTFHEVLQQDLDFVKLRWNTHHIRPSRHDTIPGKPDELFFLPELSGGETN